jgi:hypothetical protein
MAMRCSTKRFDVELADALSAIAWAVHTLGSRSRGLQLAERLGFLERRDVLALQVLDDLRGRAAVVGLDHLAVDRVSSFSCLQARQRRSPAIISNLPPAPCARRCSRAGPGLDRGGELVDAPRTILRGLNGEAAIAASGMRWVTPA